MMLSQPTMTGVFVVAAAVAFAGGWMQRDAVAWLTSEPATRQVDTARTGVPEVPEAERVATTPARMVSGPDADHIETASTGPIVTVNGRPIDGSAEAEDKAPAATASAKPAPETDAQTETRAVAAIEPPRPMPRPEGLSVPQSQQAAVQPPSQPIDYEAITAVAHGAARPAPNEGFMSYEQRASLAPLPEGNQPMPGRVGQDELVAVVGPNGDVLWVYEDQAVGATQQGGRPVVNRGNPYGFVYDDYDFRW